MYVTSSDPHGTLSVHSITSASEEVLHNLLQVRNLGKGETRFIFREF